MCLCVGVFVCVCVFVGGVIVCFLVHVKESEQVNAVNVAFDKN